MCVEAEPDDDGDDDDSGGDDDGDDSNIDDDTSHSVSVHAEADSFFCFTNLMAEIRDSFMKSLDETQCGIGKITVGD